MKPDSFRLNTAVGLFRCFAFIALQLPCAASLAAQAGGGGGFGGSGGGGGGAEIAGEVIHLLVRFTIHYPQYGIPIWIVIGIGFIYIKRGEKSFRITRTIRKGRKSQEKRLRSTALAAIAKRDNAFSESMFLDRVRTGFELVQTAWSGQQLGRCRAFISDGVHERFALYIAMQKAENIRNRMREVRVRSASIVTVTSDVYFDTIHVKFVASAISYNEDLKTGQRVGGNSDRSPINFTEVWSFSRRTGVATQPEASLMQGQCPNCGGGLEIVDVATCPHCESQVNSGQYDWVLAEITQMEEWVVPPVSHSVAGWSALSSDDPGLNFQHLEDRASVMFWRCLMAVYFEDLKFAKPVMFRDRDSVPGLWRLGKGRFWKTPAVGTVEVIRCRKAASEDGFDRVHVLVRWSARRAEGARTRARMLDRQRIYSHVLVLKRLAGARSKVEQAFTSSNCHNCGAPVEVGREAVCKFCETVLNDGALDWVLENVEPFSPVAGYQREDWQDDAANQGVSSERLEEDRFLNEPELLVALAQMVTSDGVLHEKERKYLVRLAERRGVSGARLEHILQAAAASEQAVQLPDSKKLKYVFMDHLIRAALIDGRITRSERKLLVQAAAQSGWSEEQLKVAIVDEREELYRQAKKILKRRPD